MRDSIHIYYQLAKPGIIYGNAITAIAGFFLASGLKVDWSLGIVVILGVCLVIGSACVINNILDIGIDKRMERTKLRSLVTGRISIRNAIIYAVLLGIFGFSLLAVWTNELTLAIGVVAYIFYIAIYGYAKRHSKFSTIIGAVPGALPPVAGYTAVTGSIDSAAILLFLILGVWQLGHFYAISIFRQKDYMSAGVPVWSVAKGIPSAKIHTVVCVILFLIISPLMFYTGKVGFIYLISSIILGLIWLWSTIPRQQLKRDAVAWARRVFGFSLITLLVSSTLLSVGGLLP